MRIMNKIIMQSEMMVAKIDAFIDDIAEDRKILEALTEKVKKRYGKGRQTKRRRPF